MNTNLRYWVRPARWDRPDRWDPQARWAQPVRPATPAPPDPLARLAQLERQAHGIKVSPGQIVSGGATAHYIPMAATISNVSYQSFWNLANEDCQNDTATLPAYPAPANDPAVTGINISDPSALEVTIERYD